jgi:hypothetical protein
VWTVRIMARVIEDRCDSLSLPELFLPLALALLAAVLRHQGKRRSELTALAALGGEHVHKVAHHWV